MATEISMDWGNLQFKAKDIIILIVYVALGMGAINKISNSVDRQSDKISSIELRLEKIENKGDGTNKETQAFLQSIQVQVNTINTEIAILKQRFLMSENREMRN